MDPFGEYKRFIAENEKNVRSAIQNDFDNDDDTDSLENCSNSLACLETHCQAEKCYDDYEENPQEKQEEQEEQKEKNQKEKERKKEMKNRRLGLCVILMGYMTTVLGTWFYRKARRRMLTGLE